MIGRQRRSFDGANVFNGIERANPRFVNAQARFRRHAVSPEDAAAAIIAGVERGRSRRPSEVS